ncbi:hypothetical protein BD408DRAFT_442012 [Parasitella parasitica]|nr:hypothetical protein BD408DRAFT_442012 [Parasitella parasitica]
MGQQQSNGANAPLTFGYIGNSYHEPENNEGTGSDSRDRTLPDFVLDNPHLYKLEPTCQHCSSKKHYSMMAADQRNTQLCRCYSQEKRLSLVKRDLANDLNYIDETYYPNIVHYEDDDDNDVELDAVFAAADASTPTSANSLNGSDAEDDSIMSEDDDDNNTLRGEEGWSKLTLDEIMPSSTPKRLVSGPSLALDLSGRSLIKLSSSISHLDNLTKLDLSNNQMINLPRAIGRLKNLRIFNASKNQLETIPDTITSLGKLKAINLSHNNLTTLPKGIGSLPNLIILVLNHNQLSQLPRELSNLDDMITLNVSHNPLKTIPAEISALKSLRKLTAVGCAFENEVVHTLAHDPPSLLEICARNMVKNSISLPASLSHCHIVDYFEQKQTCSFCFGPYFESFVSRSRFIERAGRQVITLDYQLCCAHWTDENDRVSAMFSTPYYKRPHSVTPTSGASMPICALVVQQQPSPPPPPPPPPSTPPFIDTEGVSSAPVLEEHVQQQDCFLSSCSSSEDIPCLPTTAENEALNSAAAAINAFPTTTTTITTTSISLLSSSSKPKMCPRSSSASSLRPASATHRRQQPASTALLRLRHENLALPFAALHGRQSEEADRILTRQSARKSNAFKQGFVQLGARLNKKNGNHSLNNQSSRSDSNSNRDRSETV